MVSNLASELRKVFKEDKLLAIMQVAILSLLLKNNDKQVTGEANTK